MLLADVVETSTTVTATRSRLAKIDALASLLARVPADEIVAATGYLVGDAPQGPHRYRLGDAARPRRRERRRAGADHRATSRTRSMPCATPPVPVRSAPGATSSTALFARATPAEADFLRRLLLGELRQGALEGVMTDAIAARVRRPASRRAARRDARAATCAPPRTSRSPVVPTRSRRSRSTCCDRSCRCSRRPRKT